MAEAKEEFVAQKVLPDDAGKERIGAEMYDFIDKVEQDMLDQKLRDTYNLLKSPPNSEWSDEPEIQWRLARSCVRLAQALEKGGDEHIALIKEGVDIMKKCEDKITGGNSKYFVNFLMAGLMGLATEHMPTEEKVKHSSAVRDYAMKAHEADEEQAGPLHILGMWCFRIAEIDVATRAASAVVYSSLPESSFEEALTYLSKSLRKDKVGSPTYALSMLAIGKVLYKMDDKEGSELWFNKLVNLKTELPSYKELQRQAKEELKALKKSKSWW